MDTVDHQTLMAYVDGELDGETAKEVEEHLKRNAESRAIVNMFRETAGIVRSAVLPYGHAPVPDRLVNAIRSAPGGDGPRRDAGRRDWGRLVAALAAGLALMALSGGGGYLAAEHRTAALKSEQLEQQQVVARYRHDAVQTALTTLVSGKSLDWNSENTVHGRIVPIRTFKNKKGQYCREYRDQVSRGGQMSLRYGVACLHADKVWHDIYMLVPADSSSATPGLRGTL